MRVQESGSRIGRRSVIRGAAWTPPTMLVGVTVPAYAASICLPKLAALTYNTKPTALTFNDSPVTATVGFTQLPGNTGTVRTTDYSPSWNYLAMNYPKPITVGDSNTMTIRFSKPVRNVTLTITDIDYDKDQWKDEVVVSPAPSTVVKGTNVIGSGTTGSPFTTSHDGNISSNAGDVRLVWLGPLDTVTITYKATDAKSKSQNGQHIGVGRIGFDTC